MRLGSRSASRRLDERKSRAKLVDKKPPAEFTVKKRKYVVFLRAVGDKIV